jgi:hypothetical protein
LCGRIGGSGSSLEIASGAKALLKVVASMAGLKSRPNKAETV